MEEKAGVWTEGEIVCVAARRACGHAGVRATVR